MADLSPPHNRHHLQPDSGNVTPSRSPNNAADHHHHHHHSHHRPSTSSTTNTNTAPILPAHVSPRLIPSLNASVNQAHAEMLLEHKAHMAHQRYMANNLAGNGNDTDPCSTSYSTHSPPRGAGKALATFQSSSPLFPARTIPSPFAKGGLALPLEGKGTGVSTPPLGPLNKVTSPPGLGRRPAPNAGELLGASSSAGAGTAATVSASPNGSASHRDMPAKSQHTLVCTGSRAASPAAAGTATTSTSTTTASAKRASGTTIGLSLSGSGIGSMGPSLAGSGIVVTNGGSRPIVMDAKRMSLSRQQLLQQPPLPAAGAGGGGMNNTTAAVSTTAGTSNTNSAATNTLTHNALHSLPANNPLHPPIPAASTSSSSSSSSSIPSTASTLPGPMNPISSLHLPVKLTLQPSSGTSGVTTVVRTEKAPNPTTHHADGRTRAGPVAGAAAVAAAAAGAGAGATGSSQPAALAASTQPLPVATAPPVLAPVVRKPRHFTFNLNAKQKAAQAEQMLRDQERKHYATMYGDSGSPGKQAKLYGQYSAANLNLNGGATAAGHHHHHHHHHRANKVLRGHTSSYMSRASAHSSSMSDLRSFEDPSQHTHAGHGNSNIPGVYRKKYTHVKTATELKEEELEHKYNGGNKLSLEQKELRGEKAFDELAMLTTIPFFEDLSMKSLQKLTKSFRRKMYKPGERIIQQGSHSRGFHVLVRGSVRLSAFTNNGEEIELAVREKGQYFCEWSLIEHGNEYGSSIEPVTITSLDDSIILSISAEQFGQFVKENPNVGVNVVNYTGGRSISLQLHSIPFFQSISELKLQQLATLFELKSCGEGEYICRQGDDANGFYILVEGRINVSATGPGGVPIHLNTLKKGDMFGEIALTQNTLRTATLTTVQPCVLLYLSQERFRTFLILAPEMRENGLLAATIFRRTANTLKTIPLFSCLARKEIGPLTTYDEKKLGLLGELFTFMQLDEGVVMFRQHDPPDAFYIIIKGSVAVKKLNEEAIMAQEQMNREENGSQEMDEETQLPKDTLVELTKNSWFGEIALMAHTRRTATVVTTSSCVLLKLHARDFDKFLTLVPEVRPTLEREVSSRTAATLHQIPFFSTVKENKPWSKIGILGSMFTFEAFRGGEVVFKEGDTLDNFYVIVHGVVEVSKAVKTRVGLEDIVIDTIGQYGWFGELSLIKDVPRLVTVTCKDYCLFLSVSRDHFNKFISIAPDILDHFSSLVSHRTANILRSMDFFYATIKENKPWSKMELLCSMFTYAIVPNDTVVFCEGDPVTPESLFYIIAVGSVEVTCKEKPASVVVAPVEGETKDSEARTSSPHPAAAASAAAAAAGAGGSMITSRALERVNASHAVATGATGAPSASLTERSNDGGGGGGSRNSPYVTPRTLAALKAKNRAKLLDQGTFFGEVSLLRGIPRTQTVRTKELCVFFTLPRDKFDQFLKIAPELRNSLLNLYPDLPQLPLVPLPFHGATSTTSPRPARRHSAGNSPFDGGNGNHGTGLAPLKRLKHLQISQTESNAGIGAPVKGGAA